MKKPTKIGTTPSDPKNKVFFMVCATAIYRVGEPDEKQVKQRTLNILLEHDNINLSKKELDDANRAIINRLNKENKVEPNQVLDVVFNAISILGMMPADVFYGKKEEPAVN